MREVLVTGHTGFIGTAVTEELLSRGWRVTGISRKSSTVQSEGLRQVELDLLDRPSVEDFFRKNSFEAVLHLAWYIGPKCHIHDINMDWLEASLHLLRCFQQSGGRIFQANGTVSEYDFSFGYLSEEKTPLNNASLHGQCKAALYHTAQTFCRQHGMTFKWPRVFNLYGPGERTSRLMPSVILSALRGEDIRVSDCLQIQDYLHVADTAAGIVDVFESDVVGAVNICSGTPVRLRSIVQSIVELTRFQGKVLWGALPGALEFPIIVGANQKLTGLGWSPRFSLEDGLKQTIEWWRNHHVS